MPSRLPSLLEILQTILYHLLHAYVLDPQNSLRFRDVIRKLIFLAFGAAGVPLWEVGKDGRCYGIGDVD